MGERLFSHRVLATGERFASMRAAALKLAGVEIRQVTEDMPDYKMPPQGMLSVEAAYSSMEAYEKFWEQTIILDAARHRAGKSGTPPPS